MAICIPGTTPSILSSVSMMTAISLMSIIPSLSTSYNLNAQFIFATSTTGQCRGGYRILSWGWRLFKESCSGGILYSDQSARTFWLSPLINILNLLFCLYILGNRHILYLSDIAYIYIYNKSASYELAGFDPADS